MRRYEGTGLGAHPRVAVIANDAIGNFVVATPLLQMVRRELGPSVLHYFGGKRTMELERASDLFDRSFALHGRELQETIEEVDEDYDLVINVEQGEPARKCAAALSGGGWVCGPVEDLPYPDDIRGDLWRDQEWIAPDLAQKYPFLESCWIAEIYARLAYLGGTVPLYRVPQEAVEHDFDVLIATSASLPEKLWPLENWLVILGQLSKQGLKVGLLGAPSKDQGKHWKGADAESEMVASGLVEDCRGIWTLPQVVGAMAAARMILTLDNGIMHLAASTSTPTVALFRYGIHRLWTPPVATVHPVITNEGEDVAAISTDAVSEAIKRVF